MVEGNKQRGDECRLTIGLLWFDNDPTRTLEDKIVRAAQRYQKKHGHAPDTCYVNRGAMEGDKQQINGLHVVAVHNVLPHHFFVGVAGKEKNLQ